MASVHQKQPPPSVAVSVWFVDFSIGLVLAGLAQMPPNNRPILKSKPPVRFINWLHSSIPLGRGQKQNLTANPRYFGLQAPLWSRMSRAPISAPEHLTGVLASTTCFMYFGDRLMSFDEFRPGQNFQVTAVT